LVELYSRSSIEERVWELIAYLGRYAHQPATVCLKLTLRQLHMLNKYTDKMVRVENGKPV
jgi:hypothetical protein